MGEKRVCPSVIRFFILFMLVVAFSAVASADLGNLTVIKQVINDDGGNLAAADFSINVALNGTPILGSPFNGSGTGITFSLDAGIYNVVEDPSPNYAQSFSGNCDVSGNVTVADDTSVSCTITNNDVAAANATLTINKIVINDDGRTNVAADFDLFINGRATTSGASVVLSAGTYVVTESSNPNYALSFSGDCSSDGSIALSPGDSKTCNLTNNDNADANATLTITKVVVNDDGGSNVVSDFSLFVNGSAVGSGSEISLVSGAYQVTELSLPDYTATISGDCSADGMITLASGDNKSCTITNDDIDAPACHTNISSLPVTCEDGFITSDIKDGPCRTISCTSGQSNVTVLACEKPDNEVKTFFEVYKHSSFGTAPKVCLGDTCLDNGFAQSSNYPICTVAANATLTVTKLVVNDDSGTKAAADFTIKIDNNVVSSGVAVPVAPGEHSVSEVLDPDYSATFGGDCSLEGKINLSSKQSKSCTITNNDIAKQNASLTVTKVVVNDNNGNKTNADFTLKVGSNVVESGVKNIFAAGNYVVSETNADGYGAEISGDCAADGKITLNGGDDKSCTITNDDIPPVPEEPDCSVTSLTLGATCEGGTIVSDTNDGSCRTVKCSSGGNSVTVKACDKPDSGEKSYFEMYKQSESGVAPKICIGSTCLQANGYVKSGSYPICEGTTQPPEPEPETASASISIAPFYPKGRDYVFKCSVTGFTPSDYGWDFGDGDKQLNSLNKDVYHSYKTAGTFTVSCTAKNSQTSKTATMTVNVA